ncbi:MAG: hypothetical protein KDK07_11740 [Bauldia sp.]|nr:hypothetical protein [Bauldia sp.]
MPVDVNKLGFAERALSVVLGLGIAAAGAKPRPNPILNVVALAAGSYLAWRGATGRDPLGIEVMDRDDRA